MSGAEPRRTITVAIPTLGRFDEVRDTIEGILSGTVQPEEILVSDQNVPNHPELDRYLDSRSPIIRHLRTEPLGVVFNMNSLLRSSRNDVILFIDDDVVPSKTLVEAHLKNYSDPNIAGVAGRVEQPSGDMLPEKILSVGTFNRWTGGMKFHFNGLRRQLVVFAQGANMSFDREKLASIGGFDEGFGGNGYYFESDATLRLVQKFPGGLVFDPDASLKHLAAPRGGARVSNRALHHSFVTRNGVRLYDRHCPTLILPFLMAKMLITTILKSIYRASPDLGLRGAAAQLKGLAESTKLGSLFTLVLVLQLSLALFCPPVPLASLLVFPADLWAFAWTPLFLGIVLFREKNEDQRKLLITVVAAFLITMAVFMHGAFRPPFSEQFDKFVGSPTDDAFRPAKEFFVAFRFYIWLIAAIVTSRLPIRLDLILRSLAVLSALAVLSLFSAWVSPPFGFTLGIIYGYLPDAPPWPERIYGIFRSPIEGSLVLSFSFLVLISTGWAHTRVRILTLSALLFGIFLTKTLTGFSAVVVALSVSIAIQNRGRVVSVLLGGFTMAAASTFYFIRDTDFFRLKYANLLFRLKPWEIYFDLLSSRIDLLLLGLGFQPYFTDNSYVFLLSRGGLVLLFSSLLAFLAWWRSHQMNWGIIERAIPLFFVISGLTVDSLIIRPVVYVLICAGVAKLYSPKSPNSGR